MMFRDTWILYLKPGNLLSITVNKPNLYWRKLCTYIKRGHNYRKQQCMTCVYTRHNIITDFHSIAWVQMACSDKHKIWWIIEHIDLVRDKQTTNFLWPQSRGASVYWLKFGFEIIERSIPSFGYECHVMICFVLCSCTRLHCVPVP